MNLCPSSHWNATACRPEAGHFTLVSHGTIEERYGLDTAVEAVARLRPEIPALRLRIYGEGSDKARLVPRIEWRNSK